MTAQTTLTTWAHLPNAAHIDRILAHIKAHPERWNATRDAISPGWATAWDAAWAAIGSDTQYTKGKDIWWDVAWDMSGTTMRGAIRALIAWDDCAHFLDMPADAVKVFAVSGHHPAVLLYPAVLALSEE